MGVLDQTPPHPRWSGGEQLPPKTPPHSGGEQGKFFGCLGGEWGGVRFLVLPPTVGGSMGGSELGIGAKILNFVVGGALKTCRIVF